MTQETTTNTKAARYFDIVLNGNFAFPAYTLEVDNAREARNIAVKEAKFNANATVTIIEVDIDGDVLDNGYCSETIKIK